MGDASISIIDPPAIVGYCYDLPQAYGNSSFAYLYSIEYPNHTFVPINAYMTKSGGFFNYTYCDFNYIGTYGIHGIMDVDGKNQTFNYYLPVTADGLKINAVMITVYIFFLLLCLLLIYFSVKLFMKYKYSKDVISGRDLYETKKRNEMLYYLKIFKQKLWIVGIFGIYLSLLLFMTISSQLLFSLGLLSLKDILSSITYVMLWGLIPFILFWFIYVLLHFVFTFKEIVKYEYGVFEKENKNYRSGK